MKAFYFSAALAGLFLLTGCDQDKFESTSAGKGGAAALRISLNHKGTVLQNGVVRIRYNATVPPVSAAGWDDSADVIQLPSTAGEAIFPSLRPGNYYIYGTAYLPNSTFKEPKIVSGGFAYTLNENKAVNIALPLDKVEE